MRQKCLVDGARQWAAMGIDYIQLREKTLPGGELLELAQAMVAVLRESGAATKLLLSGRADVALAARADGVHLTAGEDELLPEQVRQVFANTSALRPCVSKSCHTVAEIESARDAGTDLLLFGPVFEKRVGGRVVVEGVGFQSLARACQAAGDVPVLALGGVTEETAGLCVKAGAAGIAGIRLFGARRGDLCKW